MGSDTARRERGGDPLQYYPNNGHREPALRSAEMRNREGWGGSLGRSAHTEVSPAEIAAQLEAVDADVVLVHARFTV